MNRSSRIYIAGHRGLARNAIIPARVKVVVGPFMRTAAEHDDSRRPH